MATRAVDARVTLEHDHTRVPEKQFSCSIRIGVRGPDLFAKDVESDLYAAIDVVMKKIEQQIRKRHNQATRPANTNWAPAPNAPGRKRPEE